MPFNSSGTYTPVSGAITAAPGDVIRSATWNAIFNDMSSALTSLGKQVYGSTAVTSTPYVPDAADAFLLVNVAGATAINLAASSTRSGYPLAIKDASGVAHTNQITITPNGAETIDGLATLTISSDYGYYSLFPVTGGWVSR